MAIPICSGSLKFISLYFFEQVFFKHDEELLRQVHQQSHLSRKSVLSVEDIVQIGSNRHLRLQ